MGLAAVSLDSELPRLARRGYAQLGRFPKLEGRTAQKCFVLGALAALLPERFQLAPTEEEMQRAFFPEGQETVSIDSDVNCLQSLSCMSILARYEYILEVLASLMADSPLQAHLHYPRPGLLNLDLRWTLASTLASYLVIVS
jgi:hypothetical protein